MRRKPRSALHKSASGWQTAIIAGVSDRSETEIGPMSMEGKPRSADPESIERWRETKPNALRSQLAAPSENAEPRHLRARHAIGKLAGLLTVAAVLASAALLFSDAVPHLITLIYLLIVQIPRAWAWLGHAPLSALPLLLAGASYVLLQALLRPAPLELFRRLMLGGAFLLWGVVQLMPPSALATDLGDVVIALYVFDLALMIQAELQSY
jgi:hypothetical protein